MELPNDVSANELQLRKLDDRDKFFRVIQLLVLAAVVAITMFALLNIRQLANENRQNIVQHREQIETANVAASEQLRVAALGNRARGDINLCIISVSPTVRTPDYVKSCYDLVEKKHDIKVERFGDGQ